MTEKLKVLDLFSGIGGFSLGLERTGGFETVAFCEIDEPCQKILRKHWPKTVIHSDVTKMEFKHGAADIITAGFPCQDISAAGWGAGLAGERSGLFRNVVDAIRMVRPQFTLLENVAALLFRGMGEVLGNLAEIGCDAEWNCIPANAVGAVHSRDRVWIVAYDHKIGRPFPTKIYNSISNQIKGYRPCRSALALLSKARQVEFGPDDPDHRKLYGLSDAVDRASQLGNTVHPEIIKVHGHAILQAEAS